MPPPMHSDAMPFLALRLPISCSRVTRMRQPEAPIGWPIAIAPPLTLTLLVFQPISLLTAQACAAKASLISSRSRSCGFQPARCNAFCDAGTGPHAHDARVQRDSRVARDARERRQAELCSLLRRHQHDTSGPQARQRFGVGLLVDELVGRKDDRVALLLR